MFKTHTNLPDLSIAMVEEVYKLIVGIWLVGLEYHCDFGGELLLQARLA